jgi:hypothetical protein
MEDDFFDSGPTGVDYSGISPDLTGGTVPSGTGTDSSLGPVSTPPASSGTNLTAWTSLVNGLAGDATSIYKTVNTPNALQLLQAQGANNAALATAKLSAYIPLILIGGVILIAFAFIGRK